MFGDGFDDKIVNPPKDLSMFAFLEIFMVDVRNQSFLAFSIHFERVVTPIDCQTHFGG